MNKILKFGLFLVAILFSGAFVTNEILVYHESLHALHLMYFGCEDAKIYFKGQTDGYKAVSVGGSEAAGYTLCLKWKNPLTSEETLKLNELAALTDISFVNQTIFFDIFLLGAGIFIASMTFLNPTEEKKHKYKEREKRIRWQH